MYFNYLKCSHCIPLVLLYKQFTSNIKHIYNIYVYILFNISINHRVILNNMYKHVLRKSLFLIIVAVIMSCSSNQSYNWDGVLNTTEISLYPSNDLIHLSDEFSDFELVALENNRNCMISTGAKLSVTDSAYYILNTDWKQQFLLFDKSGKYKSRIGCKGHGRGEYDQVSDFYVSENGVASVLTYNKIQCYNQSGKFDRTIDLNENNGCDYISYIESSPILASHYRNKDHLLNIIDTENNITEKILPVDTTNHVTFSPVIGIRPLQVVNKTICYLDYLSSTFYIIDKEKSDTISRIVLKSPKMLTEKLSKETDELSSDYDEIESFVFTGTEIIGLLTIDKKPYNFEIDINKRQVKLSISSDILYNFDAYHNGWFYKIVTPGWLLNHYKFRSPKTSPLPEYRNKELGSSPLVAILDPIIQTISEKNNAYILKMKK